MGDKKMGHSLKDSAEKVQRAVSSLGYEFRIVEFTKTNLELAQKAKEENS